MPGITIPQPGGEDPTPTLILFYHPSVPASVVQKVAIEQLSADVDKEVVSVLESPQRVSSRGVESLPTTVLVSGGEEIERWEEAKHESHILSRLGDL